MDIERRPGDAHPETPVSDASVWNGVGTPPDADVELMLRFQAGDEEAFAGLVRRYQDRIVSLAYRYLSSAADAEDLAQEVFLRVYRARESYRPTAKFSTWIHRITANASLNHLRGTKSRRSVSAPLVGRDGESLDIADEQAETPQVELEKDELARVLRRIVEELPDRQRIAILLNKYEGLGYEEVAQSMDMTVTAVKSLLTRARVNIRERLEPYIETGSGLETGSGFESGKQPVEESGDASVEKRS